MARVGEHDIVLSTQKEYYLQYSIQVSNEVLLYGGRRYFIEIVYVEAGGANHLSLVWKRYGNKFFEILGGEFLSPYFDETPIKSKIGYDTDILESISGRTMEKTPKKI